VNVILVISDTLRRDHLGCYGNPWISTPNIDRLAMESVAFDNYYVGSYATVPVRYEILTGRHIFTYSAGWVPLPPDEVVLAQVLGQAGVASMMIVDTPHILKDGFGYDRGFSAWRWLRGQETDRLRMAPLQVTLPCAPEKLRNPHTNTTQYLRNVATRRSEADYFAPQTMTTALRWLECNRTVQPFLLWIDEFDPHEPWDPPQHYIDMYDSGYQGEQVISPLNGPAGYLSPAELKQVQALYAGEVTMVDRWVGRVLDAIDDLGLRERTIVLVLSDHGHYLDYPGDQGRIGKPAPLFEGVAHQNFMLRPPAGLGGGQLHSALVQPVDLLPTLLDLTGGTIPGFCEGSSLRGVLDGGTSNRQVAISAPHRGVPTITSQDWSFIFVPPTSVGAARLDGQTNELVRNGSAQWTSLLFDLRNDPLQQHDVLAGHHQEARDLYAAFAAFLHERNPAALDLYPPPAW